MNTEPRVSIIIACRNERDYIELALRSILAQEIPPGGFEVIAADGMSDDGTRNILNRVAIDDYRVRIIDNPGRTVSIGLNLAIREARGEVIVRMDAHTEYSPNYVQTCLSVLRETAADNVGGPARTNGIGYMQSAICAAYHSAFAVGRARFHDSGYEGFVDTVPYGCWPREVFDRVGLFDEGLVRNQDDEFNLRLTRAGGKIWQSPLIESWYKPRASLLLLLRQYAQYGYWKVRVIQKHRLPASPRHIVPGAFVLSLISLPLLSLLWAPLIWIWLGLVAIYSACNIVWSFLTAYRRGWNFLPLLPFVFACYHFSYGYGFLRGIWDFIVLRHRPGNTYTELTRESENVMSRNLSRKS